MQLSVSYDVMLHTEEVIVLQLGKLGAGFYLNKKRCSLSRKANFEKNTFNFGVIMTSRIPYDI